MNQSLAVTADDMRAYYLLYKGDDGSIPPHWQACDAALDALAARTPRPDALELRTELYRKIVEFGQPKIFRGSPFFFELGMRRSWNWGTPDSEQPASWPLRRARMSGDYEERGRKLFRYHLNAHDPGEPVLWNIYNRDGFDVDHYCFGYRRIVPLGTEAWKRRISERRADPELSDAGRAELDAMLAGVTALEAVAERFRETALILLDSEKDPAERENLARIAATAERIPKLPPENFYEGLQTMIFYREVTATLEGVGMSLLGRPDCLLIDLYRRDLAAGTLSEAEARDLIDRWLMVHDIKTFARERDWPETSTCLELGGCDDDGNEVFNELTTLFIEEHFKLKLLNPKLNCRFSSRSDDAYLELMARCVLAGHNQFAWLNDDVLIPAQMRYGKTLRDARAYVNGGCQETMCEGVEHTAGGFFYINMPGVLSVWFAGREEGSWREVIPEVLAEQDVDDFDRFYARWLATLVGTIRCVTNWARENGRLFSTLKPGPLFSASLDGCIENATDYTAGGARYNPTGVTLAGFANVVNSLYAIKKAVFEEKFVDLETLIAAVRADWSTPEYAVLRERILGLPRFGRDNREVDELAARFSADVTAAVRSMPNERGAHYQPSYFVYFFFEWLGQQTGATPDGRRAGTGLTQGVSPSRERAPESITEVIASLSRIDFRDAPGNAVWDWQLPLGGPIDAATVREVIRVAGQAGIPTIQPNCVDPAALRDAQLHPERHGDLVVRISGLSAVFVRLDKYVQDEIISRAIY